MVSLVCLLLVLPALAASAASGGERVTVLVGFNGSAGARAVAQNGGRIEREFKFINAAKVTMPARAVERLAQAPGIRYVEPDLEVRAFNQTVPWGIERVNAPQVQAAGPKGAGIKVAILDTGILLNHEDLTVYGGFDTFGNNNYNDDNGHGTHVAGTVAALDNGKGVIGVAPQAHLYAVKVLNASGSGSFSNIITGIEWSINNGMQVINMSLGARSGSQALQDACDAAYSAGILVVAAAGNDGTIRGNRESISYPARYPSVIAVGSITSSNTRSSFSSTGSTLEIMAPGSSILSTTYDGGYGTMSGTSMASPHVAGVAALVWSANTQLTNVQLRTILNSTANDMWNDPFRYGNGLVDAWAAYNAALGQDPGDPGDPNPTAINVAIATDKASYTLRETITATVTATDQNNAALSGAEVTLVIVTASNRSYTFTATTGSDGKATFSYSTKNPDGRGTYTLTATVVMGVTGTASITVQVN